MPPEAAGQNTSVGTLSFGSRRSEHSRRMPPARTLPSAHSRLVAGAADAKIRPWRIKHRRLQTAAEAFSPALYIRARVVRNYMGIVPREVVLRAKIRNSKILLLGQVIRYERKSEIPKSYCLVRWFTTSENAAGQNTPVGTLSFGCRRSGC